jgi:hypothetical protein
MMRGLAFFVDFVVASLLGLLFSIILIGIFILFLDDVLHRHVFFSTPSADEIILCITFFLVSMFHHYRYLAYRFKTHSTIGQRIFLQTKLAGSFEWLSSYFKYIWHSKYINILLAISVILVCYAIAFT